jgi:Tol biopolymer transport system component
MEVAPLDPAEFIFLRSYLPPDANDRRVQIWSYHAGTGKERLLSDLAGDLRLNSMAGGLALSPDRKWVAFAARFRPTDHPDFGAFTRMIWKVRIDGELAVQVTPNLADPRASCRMDTECVGAADHECDNGKCTPYAWRYGYEHPNWAPDGGTLLFHLVETYCQNFNCLPMPVTDPYDPNAGQLPAQFVGGVPMSITDTPGARPQQLPSMLGKGCSIFRPQISPDGRKLAGNYACGLDVFNLFTSNADGSSPETFRGGAGFFRWRKDSQAIYYKAPGREIRLLNLADKTQQTVLTLASGIECTGFAISPDGQFMLLNLEYPVEGGRRTNLFLLDLNGTPPAPQQITRDGTSFL